MPRHKHHQLPATSYIRASFFGFEDSLVSTTGFITGIAFGAKDTKFILLAAFVAVSVEAISMAAGEFLSEETEQEVSRRRPKTKLKYNPIIGGVLMCISYFAAGMVPITPYLMWPISVAIPVSIIAALIGLFGLGLIKGKLARRSMLQNGLQVLLVGGIATAMGVIVGISLKAI